MVVAAMVVVLEVAVVGGSVEKAAEWVVVVLVISWLRWRLWLCDGECW